MATQKKRRWPTVNRGLIRYVGRVGPQYMSFAERKRRRRAGQAVGEELAKRAREVRLEAEARQG